MHEFLTMLYLSEKKTHMKKLFSSSEIMKSNEKQMNYAIKSSVIFQY